MFKAYSGDSSPIEPFKEEDVSKAVKQLNAGKVADEYGIVAEHRHSFNHNFAIHLLIPNFTIFKIP
jgi:hypothetical protein